MISADRTRLSSTVCLALRLAEGADCFSGCHRGKPSSHPSLCSVAFTEVCWGDRSPRCCSGSTKSRAAGQELLSRFSFTLTSAQPFVEVCKNSALEIDKQWWTNLEQHAVYLNLLQYKKNPIKLPFEGKQIITWVPCELLHIPETNDEQQNVAAKSFLDIYRIKYIHLWLWSLYSQITLLRSINI